MPRTNPKPIQPRYALRSTLAVWSIRLALSIVLAFVTWWSIALILNAAISIFGFRSSPGSFFAAALVWISPLGAGWFVLVLLFLVSLQLSRYVVGIAKTSNAT